tara:strand:+ start:58 stop:603 length:546 start_codon:yes stop_codon:yes gene_type:complete
VENEMNQGDKMNEISKVGKLRGFSGDCNHWTLLTRIPIQGDIASELKISIEGTYRNFEMRAVLNEDSGRNYRNYQIMNAGTINASCDDSSTGIEVLPLCSGFVKTTAIVYGKSGQERVVTINSFAKDGGSNGNTGYWRNTTDPLKSIVFYVKGEYKDLSFRMIQVGGNDEVIERNNVIEIK